MVSDSNPLKELLFTRDKWIYLPGADTHSTMVVFHCAFLTINRYDRGRERRFLRLVASPKTPTAVVTFVSPDRENLYLRDATAKLYRGNLLKNVEVSLFLSFFPLFFNKPSSRQRLYFIVSTCMSAEGCGAHRKRITPRIPPYGRFAGIADGILSSVRAANRRITSLQIYIPCMH